MKEKNKIIISVIVTNYNGKLFLKDCVASLYKEKANNFEVILVDDASEDGSAEFIKKYFTNYKRLHFIELKKRVGTGNAITIGTKKSRGEYVFFLNNDTTIKAGWPKAIVNFFEDYKKAVIGQAKLLRKGTSCFDYAGDYLGPFGFLIERSQGAVDQGQFNKIEKVFSIKGAAMFLRKSVFLKLGGFDSDYTFAIEETDLTWRAWLAGYETYFVPTITVWHAFGTKEKTRNYYIKSQIIYQGCKNTISTLIKNLSIEKLAIILPINISCWLILSVVSFLKLEFDRSFALIRGMLWNIVFLPKTLRKRSIIQRSRKITDEQLFKLVGEKKEICYYFNKGLSYITGKPY